MRSYEIGVLPCDGVGIEIVPAATVVTEAALEAVSSSSTIRWVPLPVGLAAINEFGSALPESTLAALGDLDGWILGPHDSANYPEGQRFILNPSGIIRKRFDLFANIRPARGLNGAMGIAVDADMVIVRENTEGFYADRNTYAGSGEFMPSPDVAIAMGIFTRGAIERVARVACELAGRRRNHVTIVHKANVLRLTTGMFRDVCREVASGYPDLRVDDFNVDAMTTHLLRRPADFDVIVTENMFGDILSDLTGQLVGSLGIAPSLNMSEFKAMAQAVHGAAPDIAGQNVANPIALIRSTCMLLEWLARKAEDDDLDRTAMAISRGIEEAVLARVATPDLGGTASTTAFTEAVIERIKGGRA